MLRGLLITVLLPLVSPLFAAVDLVVETKVFHLPGSGPRVEVNMAFLGHSLLARPTQAGFSQARVEALTIIEQAGAIKAFAKTEVHGPERLDSLASDLIHQEFFDLPAGEYLLSLEVRDLNNPDTTATRYEAPLAVGVLSHGLFISDILLAERFDEAQGEVNTKYGYRAVPLLTDYLPSHIKSIAFYAEVYGSDDRFGKDSLYLLTYQLEGMESHAVAGGSKQIKRATGRPVEPVFARFDISGLPSGNYFAVVEVRDRKGELVARRELFFQRNNPVTRNYDLQSLAGFDVSSTFVATMTDVDTLAESIRSLRPIADPLERKIIDDRWKDRDMELMQRFFYSFWSNRDPDPEAAWANYRKEVVKVNKLFGCRVMKGYETDRGYVYLKYGPPNTMMDRFNEMDSYPYSIWHYYRSGKYTNRRFVFYQPDLVSNCLTLLHSEVPGEVQNPHWNQILHSRNTPMPNVQSTGVGTQSGERANEFYQDPR